MPITTYRLLLVEDNPGDARLVEVALSDHASGEFAVTWAERVSDALTRIASERFDVVLCDLGLPDSAGINTAQVLATADPGLPLVVLTGSHNVDQGRAAIQHGAQDYLVKGEAGGSLIARSLRYAIERKRLEIELRESHDELERRVTERTADLAQANEFLREGELRYRQLFEANPIPMWVFDQETLAFLAVNDATVAHYGWSRDEFLAMTLADIRPADRIPDMLKGIASNNDKTIRVLSSKHNKKDGTLIDVDISSHAIDFQGRPARIASAFDVTDRKRTEEALARENYRNQVFLRNASDGVHIFDASGTVLEVSDSFCDMLGYTREQLLGANAALWDAQWTAEQLKRGISAQIEQEGRSVVQTRQRRSDGRIIDVEIARQGLMLEGQRVLFNSARDISERILADGKLVEAEALFRGLVEQSIAGIFIIQDGRFAYVNPRHAEIRGYDSANEVIGSDPLELIAESDRGRVAEINRKVFSGETAGVDFNFLALCKDGSTIEVSVHSTLASYRGRAAIIGLMQDVSQKSRAEEKIQQYIVQLKSAFLSTVEVATNLSEMRDPYTAGHERRVGRLAAAIGAEMEFDADRQEGLQVAGYLHDIGKITIPAEILSKPGKLSAIERQLVQSHAQAGYDVLRAVAFPWPVAQVVLQHHERVDGSGYPHGLKGEAILLDARIIAVADVVEAMASHRPYRPGFGIEPALAEIERGLGAVYDPMVAAACLRLFRAKGYSLPI